MHRGLVLGGEDAGAFQRDVDAEFFPRQFGGIAFGGNLDLAVAEADRSIAILKPLPTDPVGETRPTSFVFSRALTSALGPLSFSVVAKSWTS